MPVKQLPVRKVKEASATVTVVLPAGQDLLTEDFYSVELAEPILLEIPNEMIRSVDE